MVELGLRRTRVLDAHHPKLWAGSQIMGLEHPINAGTGRADVEALPGNSGVAQPI